MEEIVGRVQREKRRREEGEREGRDKEGWIGRYNLLV